MTDHPGPTEPSDPTDPTDPTGPAGAAADAGPADDGRGAGFDAALQGPGWEPGTRRRRSSSSGSSSSGSSSRSSSSRSSSDGPARSSSGRSSSRSRDGRRARHVRSVVVHVVLGLLGLGLAWIAVTGALAAWQLQGARSDLTALKTGIASGSDDLATTAQSLADHAHHAQVLTRGPAWAVAAQVPFLGGPLDAVRGITQETSTLVDTAAPGLVAVADDVNPRTVLTGGAVDLTAVRRAAPAVTAAAAAAASARADVGTLPDSTWLPPVDDATAQFRDQLTDLDATLRATDQALQVLPTMLGADGQTRRYFVAFQNNAELRGTGGLPGAFAIVSATDGKVTIERFESDSVLGNIPSVGLDFGKGFDQHYQGDLAYVQYANSNLSPHFPYAAQIWCSMWTNATGQQLDGALTVDPAALGYLLKATGPATAPDGEKVTADNVVALLQKDAYAKFPAAEENDERKQYILDIAAAVEKRIIAGTGNSRALLSGLTQGVQERRIVVWDRDPTVQAVLASAPIGGTVGGGDEPYGQLVVNNGGGGKLDYYLARSVRWERSGCGDTRDVTVTIALTNTAPASGLPPYVTVRTDKPDFPVVEGQVREVVDWVATKGAQLLGATLDGEPSGAGLYDEVGHPSFQTIVEIAPGQTRTWVLKLREPAGTQPLTVVDQPAVLPLDVSLDDRSCS